MSALLSTAGGILSNTAGAALKIAQENLIPILNEAVKLGQEHIVPVLTSAAVATQEFVVPAVTTAITNPGPAFAMAGEWVAEHPGQTAWYAANGAMIACPGLIAAPVLGAVGFGSAGVSGGTCLRIFGY